MSRITLTFESEKLTEEELRTALLAWAEAIFKAKPGGRADPYLGDCSIVYTEILPSRLERPLHVAPRKLDHADSLGEFVSLGERLPYSDLPAAGTSLVKGGDPFVPPRIGKVRVWKMNEEEWWAAVGTTEEVLADYMRIMVVSREEATGEEDGLPTLVSDEAMERLKFQDGGRKTFGEELAAMITAGHKFPCLFAASSG